MSQLPKYILVALFTLLGTFWLAQRAYLGWIPHDEGLLGQSAERVLAGEIPHLDFDDPYTGGLSYLHGLSFKLWSHRSASTRSLLLVFAAAFLGVFCFLACDLSSSWLAAGMASLVALVWSLPNYFAGLPSWYNLFFAIFGLGCLFRFIETRQRRWLFAAGCLAGISMLIKISGIFFLAAAALIVLYDAPTGRRADEQPTKPRRDPILLGISVIAWSVACFLLLTLLHRQLDLMFGLHFLIPGLAVAGLPVLRELEGSALGRTERLRDLGWSLASLIAGLLAMLLPVLCFFASRPGGLAALYQGVLVAPQHRFEFASYGLPQPISLVLALPFLLIVVPSIQEYLATRKWLQVVLALFLALVVALCGSQVSVYRWSWLAFRALAPLLVGVGCLMLVRKVDLTEEQKVKLYAVLALLAFCSLIQLPLPLPIYFFYTAPLVVLAAVAIYRFHPEGRSIQGFVAGFFFAFAALWLNPADPFTFEVAYIPRPESELLLPDRVGLTVRPLHRKTFEAIVDRVGQKAAGDQAILALPDSPEIYFLTGKQNPTRIFYEFLAERPPWHEAEVRQLVEVRKINVVVIKHSVPFDSPLDQETLTFLAEVFPQSERIDPYEVRWRESRTAR